MREFLKEGVAFVGVCFLMAFATISDVIKSVFSENESNGGD